jgi:hypothetical protein
MQIQGTTWSRAATAALAVLTLGSTARAEDAPGGRGFAPVVSIRAGLASGEGATGALLGGSIRFGLAPRLTLELSGDYLDRGRGASGGSALASLLIALRPTSQKVVPFVAVGGGVFFSNAERGLAFPGQGGYGPGPMGGRHPLWDDGRGNEFVPDVRGSFYGWRGDSTVGALSAGGGIRVDLGHDLSVMPDARALVVLRDGHAETIGVLSVSLGYRF